MASEEKIAIARESRMMSNTAIIPGVLLRSGKAKDELEANNMTKELGKVLQKHYDEGWDPVLPLASVVGQKTVQTTHVI